MVRTFFYYAHWWLGFAADGFEFIGGVFERLSVRSYAIHKKFR